MSTYVPGAVAGLFAGKQENTETKGNKKLLALFSAEIPKPKPRKDVSPIKEKKKRKIDESSDDSPSAKKAKLKTENGQAQTKSPKKKGQEGEEVVQSKPINRSEQRENRKKKKKDPQKEKRTIFVGNLPNKITKKQLQQFFKKHGEIESVRFRSAAPASLKLPKKAVMIKKDFHPELPNMNAYIVFKEKESTKKALESNGEELEGHVIRIDLAKTVKKHDDEKSVFVGNLPFAAKEDELRAHFEDCGKIDNVRIIRDARTGLGKGFGYILFKEKDGVTFALKFNESQFMKRKLRVQLAQEAAAREEKEKHKKKSRKEKEKQAFAVSTSKKSGDKGKKKSFSRNVPSNVRNSDYQGVKAKRIEKIKKRQKHKKDLKNKGIPSKASNATGKPSLGNPKKEVKNKPSPSNTAGKPSPGKPPKEVKNKPSPSTASKSTVKSSPGKPKEANKKEIKNKPVAKKAPNSVGKSRGRSPRGDSKFKGKNHKQQRPASQGDAARRRLEKKMKRTPRFTTKTF